MPEPGCSCASFERLEGASVPAYVAAFLEDLGRTDPSLKNRYRCRVCAREWEKLDPAAGAGRTGRPSLVRKG